MLLWAGGDWGVGGGGGDGCIREKNCTCLHDLQAD
jgi:hypothetical protein